MERADKAREYIQFLRGLAEAINSREPMDRIWVAARLRSIAHFIDPDSARLCRCGLPSCVCKENK